MNIDAYKKELKFAWTHTCGLLGFVTLLMATIGFHVNNYVNVVKNTNWRIKLCMYICGNKKYITFRPFTGDVFILYEVLAFSAYDIKEEVLSSKAVSVVFDCGANIGLSSLYFSLRYPSARIYSIEPDPGNFSLLTENVKTESKIFPIRGAIARPGMVSAYLSQNQASWGNRLLSDDERKDANSVEVPCLTIDDICNKYGIAKIDLLKVDIEGGEESLFSDPSFLSYTDFVVIELHGGYSADRFGNDVEPMGFVVRPPSPESGSCMITAVRRGN